MDPLSIAASVAGLLALTGTVVSKGYAVISKARKHAADMQVLVNETAMFSGILVAVETTFSALGSSTLATTSISPSGMSETVRACEKLVKEIDGLLAADSGNTSIQHLFKGEKIRKEAQELVTRLDKYKTFFILCLQLQSNYKSDESTKLSVEISKTVKDMQSTQVDLQSHFRGKEQAEQRSKIIRWLDSETGMIHEDMAKQRDPNSCHWILGRDQFVKWISGDEKSRFWLCGPQGSGKTALVSKVIDTIKTTCLNRDTILAYHYCRYSHSSATSPEKLLGILLCQILEARSLYQHKELTDLWHKYEGRSSYPSLEELKSMHHAVLSGITKAYLVLDGFDEIQCQTEILDFLSGVLSATDITCKVFISSRPDVDLEKAFQEWSSVHITLADTQNDMEIFIRRRVMKLQLDESETEELVRQLISLADGMFLWTACQVTQLSRVRTAISTELLRALPRGLEKAFEAELGRLDDDDLVITLKLLRHVTYAARGLDLPELIEALAMNPETRNLTQMRKNKLRRPEDVFRLLGSLVTKSPSTSKISLSHYSVYEFLTSPVLDSNRPNKYYLDKTVSNMELLLTCTTYLALDNFGTVSHADSITIALEAQAAGTVPHIFIDSPFMDYAASYWITHLNNMAQSDLKKAWPELRRFLTTGVSQFSAWVKIAQYLHDKYRYPDGTKAVHIAALHGLEFLMLELLAEGKMASSVPTSDLRTPLHIALENGNDNVIEILLDDNGVSLEQKDENGRTALYIAVECGNQFAIGRLIAKGADSNAVTRDHRTPTSIAIENDMHYLAPTLLHKVNMGISMSNGMSLLHVAAQSGGMDWLSGLVKSHGLFVKSTDKNGWTPLHYATDNGHKDAVQALLEAGSYVLPRDKVGWTPLHAAVRRRYYDCAAILLESKSPKGAPRLLSDPLDWSYEEERSDRSTLAERSTTSTSLSGKYGRHLRPSSESLLPRRTALSSSDSSGFTSDPALRRRPEREMKATSPLSVAVSDSYAQGVTLLTKHLVAWKHLGEHNEVAICLELALSQQPIVGAIVADLIQTASVGSVVHVLSSVAGKLSQRNQAIMGRICEDSYVYTKLLPEAVRAGDYKVCKFLLEYLQPVPELLAEGRFLHQSMNASTTWSRDREDILSCLIEYGAPVIDVDENGETVLRLSIARRQYEATKILLQHGASDTPSRSGETALLLLVKTWTGIKTEFEALANLIMRIGGDVHATDSIGQGVCHMAIAGKKEETLAWCLENGALPDVADKSGTTPIHAAVQCSYVAGLRLLLAYFGDCQDVARICRVFDYSNMRTSCNLLLLAIRTQKLDLVRPLVEFEHRSFKYVDDQSNNTQEQRQRLYVEALGKAILDKSSDVVDFLLSRMDNVNRMTSHGTTALHIATREGNTACVDVLLEKGADINAKTTHGGRTALDIATALEWTSIMKRLIKHGAKARPEHLISIVRNDDVDMAAELMKQGILLTPTQVEELDGSLSDAMSMLVLDQGAQVQPHHLTLAVRTGDVEMIHRILREYPDELDTQASALFTARKSKKADMVALILPKARRLEEIITSFGNDGYEGGGTILHQAVMAKRTDMLRYILAVKEPKQGYLETRDIHGMTALMAAVRTYNWESVEMLIQIGADVRAAREWAESAGVHRWVDKLDEFAGTRPSHRNKSPEPSGSAGLWSIW